MTRSPMRRWSAAAAPAALISCTRFPEAFAGARWIGSGDLVFDNLVLARKRVQ